jgi:hypothetical protein
VHQDFEGVNKLGLALVAYAVLAVLAWQTLSDEKIRSVTLAILAMFAIKTLLHHRSESLQQDGSQKL